MSRTKSLLILVGALLLMAGVLYLGYQSRPSPPPRTPAEPLAGLGWLPAEATLVGGIDLEALREEAWLLALLDKATGGVQEEAEYQAFVEATGFDYRRDLDRVWLARLKGEPRMETVGVAEGRVSRERILSYVQTESTVLPYEQFTIYEVPLPAQDRNPRQRRFVFAFLSDSHVAFGSSVQTVQQIIDCWLGRAAAVAGDDARARELAHAAAGRQAWVVDTADDWLELVPGDQEDQAALAEVITQMAAGLSVREEGLELTAEARCRQASQAERLRDNLGLMIVVGQLALSRDTNEAAQFIQQALGNVTLTVRDRSVQARLLLSPGVLETLLGQQPASPPEQP